MGIEEASIAEWATSGGEAEVTNLVIGASHILVGPPKIESLHSSLAIHTNMGRNDPTAPAENLASFCATSGRLTKVINLWPPSGSADFESQTKSTDQGRTRDCPQR